MHLFVGNIPYTEPEENIIRKLEQFANIHDFWIVTDKFGRSKGFGFAECDETSTSTILKMNKITINNRKLRVSKAKESSQYIEGRGNIIKPTKSFN